MQIIHTYRLCYIKMLHVVTCDSDYATQADRVTESTDPSAARKMSIQAPSPFSERESKS